MVIEGELFEVLVIDGRIGAHKLPSCRNERYRAEKETIERQDRVRARGQGLDPLGTALAEFLSQARIY